MPGIEGFELPKQFEVDETTRTERFARFIAEPLEHGYGNTIGNALRRVLLSSMEGVAVSSIRIDGVPHEFMSMPDVIEDVMDIVLNVTRLKFSCDGELPRTLELYADKAGEVTGKDIREDGVAVVLNPEQVICTLDKDRPFRMELEIDRGRGYRPSDLNKRDDQPLGTIPVNSLFSPIECVSYDIKACRVGQHTDYDRLELNVLTDGRIDPVEAVSLSARILKRHLDIFDPESGSDSASQVVYEPIELSESEEELVGRLCQSVETLDLPVRAVNVLQALQINYLGELVAHSEPDLLRHRNCGRKTVQEIKEKLQSLELSIGMELSDDVKKEIARRLAEQQKQNTEE